MKWVSLLRTDDAILHYNDMAVNCLSKAIAARNTRNNVFTIMVSALIPCLIMVLYQYYLTTGIIDGYINSLEIINITQNYIYNPGSSNQLIWVAFGVLFLIFIFSIIFAVFSAFKYREYNYRYMYFTVLKLLYTYHRKINVDDILANRKEIYDSLLVDTQFEPRKLFEILNMIYAGILKDSDIEDIAYNRKKSKRAQ